MEFFDSLFFKALIIWRLLVYAMVRVRVTVLTYILRDLFCFIQSWSCRIPNFQHRNHRPLCFRSSTFSLPSSDEDSLPYQKFACILVRGSRMALEWYVFNISDNVKHNQAPPPGPSPFLQAIFHPFSVNSHQQQHIKPAVIVPSGRKCSVLGSNNTLYHIPGHHLCVSERDDLVSRFDLTNTKKSRQEFLPPMPNGVSSAHALFLGNKLYCLGGYQENKS